MAVLAACRDQPPPSPSAAPPSSAPPAPVQRQPAPALATTEPGGIWASWTVADTGLGPITIGMTAEQANAAVNGTLELPQGQALEGCDYAFPRGVPDIGFMIEQGKIVRLDVRRADVRTALGGGVGDGEARIRQLYGGWLQVSPHKYTDGHYLTVLPTDPARPYRVIFETEVGVVTAIRAGVLPQVEYLEGCS